MESSIGKHGSYQEILHLHLVLPRTRQALLTEPDKKLMNSSFDLRYILGLPKSLERVKTHPVRDVSGQQHALFAYSDHNNLLYVNIRPDPDRNSLGH